MFALSNFRYNCTLVCHIKHNYFAINFYNAKSMNCALMFIIIIMEENIIIIYFTVNNVVLCLK